MLQWPCGHATLGFSGWCTERPCRKSVEQSSLCIVDATDRILCKAKVASEPEALVCFFHQVGAAVTRIGLEAGRLSQWLHAGLSEAASRQCCWRLSRADVFRFSIGPSSQELDPPANPARFTSTHPGRCGTSSLPTTDQQPLSPPPRSPSCPSVSSRRTQTFQTWAEITGVATLA